MLASLARIFRSRAASPDAMRPPPPFRQWQLFGDPISRSSAYRVPRPLPHLMSCQRKRFALVQLRSLVGWLSVTGRTVTKSAGLRPLLMSGCMRKGVHGLELHDDSVDKITSSHAPCVARFSWARAPAQCLPALTCSATCHLCVTQTEPCRYGTQQECCNERQVDYVRRPLTTHPCVQCSSNSSPCALSTRACRIVYAASSLPTASAASCRQAGGS